MKTTTKFTLLVIALITLAAFTTASIGEVERIEMPYTCSGETTDEPVACCACHDDSWSFCNREISIWYYDAENNQYVVIIE